MVANPLRGETELVVGEATYKLCFDINALCYAESLLGQSTDEIVQRVSDDFSGWLLAQDNADLRPKLDATLTRALLWAGLQKHHSGTHLVEAGEILSDAGMQVAAVAVLNGFFAAFGAEQREDKEGKGPPKRARKAGSG